ncbi:hypothetical protein [Mycolicibacterium iranicum]|uniref:DUF732 domain-containing protein n=1 Tax=Mycolicibacterium iranicum TaxID=912594 RepID=A0A1X1WV86_MYCIR|nr:hypothetical protein [Mycolicibacterium iranicum]ORV90388.1 hypothetical protein AWC12_06415 [Mycolicibacterium iranicum]
MNTSTGYRRTLSIVLAAVAATGALVGCRTAASPSAYDDVARNLLALRSSAGAVDEGAVVRRLQTELNPSLSTVAREEQPSVYEEACEVKNLYDAGRISSAAEGVEWLQTHGTTSYARATSVRQLAAKLIALDEDPSVVDGLEISGDALCLAS